MEKKFYTAPDLQVIEVDMKDIICQSPYHPEVGLDEDNPVGDINE